MKTSDILKFLQKEIHTTIVATTDENNLPVTCVIDMMLVKEDVLYFLTAKGKNFYKRLVERKYLSLSGLVGEDTMSSTSVSIRGQVKDVGTELLDEIFNKNTYMNDIYPTKESRQALTVFAIFKGDGEYFDLSKKPIERYSFVFGGESKSQVSMYSINNKCIGCGECLGVCPTSCIEVGSPYKIIEKNCLHCGNCLEVCKFEAVNHS